MPIRTICIPVAEIIEGGTKSEFYADLRKTLDLSVRMANIAATECVKQDDFNEVKCKKLSIYNASTSLAVGSKNPASVIYRSVEKSYKQDRWQVVRGLRSLRTYRSQPWPILHNKSNDTLRLVDVGESLHAKLKLIGGWWIVKLAGGTNHRDSIRTLRRIIESNDYGDSKIWIDKKHKAIIGVACRIPNREPSNLSGTMTVSGHREHLLTATIERSAVPFVINADECKQWMAEANRKQARLRQDRKSDANRRKIGKEMNTVSAKRNARMKTLCHEVSARIVNYAVRKRIAEIKLDLTIKSYAKVFPWFDLSEKIKYKAESAGINVVDVTQVVSEPDLSKPHVYFIYDMHAKRVKIGRTLGGDKRLGDYLAFSPDAIVLAIDNQPKNKLVSREKHWHACFDAHRVTERNERGNEVFAAAPVIAWLREADWLGNAGNLSQIMQVLDAT